MENREYYEAIRSYFGEEKQEKQAKEAIEQWSGQYLQQLLQGMRKGTAEQLNEATQQIEYVKSVCERYLASRDTYTKLAYLAGILIGEGKTGSAWVREQTTTDTFRHNITILLSRAHIKDILQTVYRHPGIQHKNLAGEVGIKPNYLSQLMEQLEEAKCVQILHIGKCTYYELTLKGNEYAGANMPAGKNEAVWRDFLMEFWEYRESEKLSAKKDSYYIEWEYKIKNVNENNMQQYQRILKLKQMFEASNKKSQKTAKIIPFGKLEMLLEN